MSNNILNDISKVYLETVVESAVPGKPAERLGAVSAIPQDEREAARQRTLAKAAAIRAKKGIKTEALDPVGKEDADVDNDGKSNTKKDKYLMNRRNVIKQELATQKEAKEVKKWWDDDGDGKGYEEGEVSGKFKKKKVKEGKEYDPMEDPDFDPHEAEKNRGVSGKNNPKGGKSLGKKKIKEGYSNWRQDLSEVIDEDPITKPIKEKKVNNKIDINPKLNESIENLGGELVEMVEIEGVLDAITDIELTILSDDLIEEVVEEFFYECLEEGYDVDEIEDMLIESIETSAAILNEAKVTLGHDTKIEKRTDKLEKVKSAVKKVARGVGYAAGSAVRGAKAIGREVKAGYASASDSESSTSSGTRKPQPYRNAHQKPGLLSRLGSKLKSGLKKAVASGARAVSRGARNVARKMDGGGSSSTPKSTPTPAAKKPAEKSADPWEGSATTPPKAKAKSPAKPKAKKKTGKLDSLLASIRKESKEVTALGSRLIDTYDKAPYSDDKESEKDSAKMVKKAKALKGVIKKEEVELDERALDAAETREKERIVKSMKEKSADFENRYPGRGKEVMYATATKMAKKMAEQVLPTNTVNDEPAIDKKKVMLNKQNIANQQIVQKKERDLQIRKLQMKKKGVLPIEIN